MSEYRSEFNSDWEWENYEFDVATASDITIHIPGTGTETDTVKYLNKTKTNGDTGCLASGFVLRPSANIQIVTINNKTFRSPISVSTAGFSVMKHRPDIHTIVLRTTVANTNIKLLVT